MADADDDRLIGTADAAVILGYSPRKVHRLAHTGAIPVIGKLGPQQALIFRAEQIEALAKKEGEQPTP